MKFILSLILAFSMTSLFAGSHHGESHYKKSKKNHHSYKKYKKHNKRLKRKVKKLKRKLARKKHTYKNHRCHGHNHHHRNQKVGMATVLLALSSSSPHASDQIMPVEAAKKVVYKALNFVLPKRHHKKRKKFHKRKKALIVLSKDHRGEHSGEVALVKSILETRLDSVSFVQEADITFDYEAYKDYDLIWYTSPGYPIRTQASVDTLKEAFYTHHKAVVMSGDDMANNKYTTINELTMLDYQNNGTSACFGESIDNNKGEYSYIVGINSDLFKYGNDIDHNIMPEQKGVRILSRAITNILQCNLKIPVITGHKIKVD